MAKWGEGDPRWIVEERPDATNVNNWHWTEKNATPWSKERFDELFVDLKIESKEMSCKVTELSKTNGEATANNRKGKLIFFYEWELELEWEGCVLSGSDTLHKGKINIPNLSEENDVDEIDIIVSINESNSESEMLKQFMYNVGRKCIREKLANYIKSLKEEYSRNLILPKKDSVVTSTVAAATNHSPKGCTESNNIGNAKSNTNNKETRNQKSANTTSNTAGSSNTIGCKLDVRTLNMVEDFHCSQDALYQALTNAEMMSAFTKSTAKVENYRGGEFHLYGGNVHGKFEELLPSSRIVLSWRLKSWPSGHYSTVTMDLEQLQSSTQLKLKQTGIPAAEFDQMERNWSRYYWHSIKTTFGYGVSLTDIL